MSRKENKKNLSWLLKLLCWSLMLNPNSLTEDERQKYESVSFALFPLAVVIIFFLIMAVILGG